MFSNILTTQFLRISLRKYPPRQNLVGRSSTRVTIFQAHFIQVYIINAYSPFTISILYKNCIGQPLQIFNFSDEICCQKFIDFLFYSFSLLQAYIVLLLYRSLKARLTFNLWEMAMWSIPFMSLNAQPKTPTLLVRTCIYLDRIGSQSEDLI